MGFMHDGELINFFNDYIFVKGNGNVSRTGFSLPLLSVVKFSNISINPKIIKFT